MSPSKTLVLNATPLIYLTKVGLRRIFDELPFRFVTVSAVKEEVVDRGKKAKVPDALAAESLFDKGIITVEDPKDEATMDLLLSDPKIHRAEALILALAKERDYTAIVDDLRARRTARVLGIRFEGTPFLLASAVLSGRLTKGGAIRAVRGLVGAGWRCGVREYEKIIQEIERL